MYKAYHLPPLDFGSSTGELISIGDSCVINEHKEIFDDKIEYFISKKTGRLNAGKITASWFPQIKADIFISHSHGDYADVVALAGWLYQNFNIIAFVDGCVWGFCEKLLKLIDDKYCRMSNGNYYDYNKRNFSTSHVYMRLAMSISEMIHNTECAFFYNTPNSIIPSEMFSSTMYTLSLWIFTELEITRKIKTRKPEKHRILSKLIKEDFRQFSDNKLFVEYEVNLSHLIKLDVNFLTRWEMMKTEFCGDKNIALDYLYENC